MTSSGTVIASIGTFIVVLATLMLFWARWPHTGEIMLLLILPLPVYLYYQAKGDWRVTGLSGST